MAYYTVRLYSFAKKNNSTEQPGANTYDFTASCLLKNNTSIINPSFDLFNVAKRTGGNADGIGDLANVNYMYVQWTNNFGRYYYVKDIISINNNRYEVTATSDPLATFKSAITGYTGMIARTSNNFDVSIYDPELAVSSKIKESHVYYKDVLPGSIGNWSGSDTVFDQVSCTMSTIGKDGMVTFNFTNIPVDQVVRNLLSGSGQWQFGVTSPGQYINSCILLPFTLSSYNDSAAIPIGNLTTSIGSNYHNINTLTTRDDVEFGFCFKAATWQANLAYTRTASGTTYYDDFRNYSDKFTTVSVWVPFVGTIAVPSIHLKANQIFGQYTISPENGQGRFELIADYSANNVLKWITIGSYAVNMAMDYPVAMGRTDYKQIVNDIATVVGDVGNVATQGVMTYMSGGAAAGGLVSGVSGLAKDGVNAVGDFAGGFKQYTVLGSAGSLAEMDDNFVEARLVIQQLDTVTEDINHEKGRSRMKYEQIGSTSRFLVMYAPSVEPTGATADEIAQINSVLANGIYIA